MKCNFVTAYFQDLCFLLWNVKKRRKTSVETRYPKNKSPNFSEDSIHWSLKNSLLSSSELFERQKRPLEVHISGTFRWLYLHLDPTTSITTPDKYPVLKRNTEQFENQKKTHSAFKKKNIILDHKLTKNILFSETPSWLFVKLFHNHIIKNPPTEGHHQPSCTPLAFGGRLWWCTRQWLRR